MRIPSDTPPSARNIHSGALQALGLRPGQTFTAQVLSHTPDGLTNLQVNNQQLSLALPSKAQIGVFLKFEFQSGGAKPQIALLGEQTKTLQPQILQAPAPNSQTTKQLPFVPLFQPKATTSAPTQNTTNSTNNIIAQPSSTLATSSSTTNTTPSSTLATPTLATPTLATPTLATSNPANSPSSISSNITSTHPSTQTNITIPLAPATKTALKLYTAQFISAKVISSNSNGQTTLQIGQQQISATIPNNPPIGTNLKFQVQIKGNQTNLVLNSTLPNNAQNPTANLNPQATIKTTTQPQTTTSTNTTQTQTPLAQAISIAIPANIAKQDSISALFTNLAGLQNNSEKINPSIIKIAQQLENTKLNFDTKMPTGQILQKAIKQSGIFLESILAQPQAALAQQNISNLKTTTQSDLKLLLLLFRSTLTKWLGEQTPPQKPNKNRPNPPVKGAPPRSILQTQTPLPQSQTPKNLAQTLLNNTDNALSRLRLFQITSLPETSARAQNINSQELNLELPFTYNGETNIIHFQINHKNTSTNEQDENGWQMRFSMNLNKIGEVGADVAFRYKKINATIWANEKETLNSLAKSLPQLKETLLEKGLDLGSIHVQNSTPKQKTNPYQTQGNIK